MLEFSANSLKKACQGSLKPPSDLPKQLKSLSKGRNSPLIIGNRPGHYYLAKPGLDEIESYLSKSGFLPDYSDKSIKNTVSYLEKIITKVGEENKRKFLSEAISCLQVSAFRATVIMIWEVVMDHLYDYIIAKKLEDFNNGLSRRSDKYSKLLISKKDDFEDINESTFIEVCKSAGIISKDVRKILDEKLGIRNTYAHPSGVEIHQTKVVNFIEDVVDNIISKYKI
ncbi:MAG: hypothetical protein NTW14_03690 [bacterium]|nr:hypothetical protein [bacterium]